MPVLRIFGPGVGGTIGHVVMHFCNLPSRLYFHSSAVTLIVALETWKTLHRGSPSTTVWLDLSSQLQEHNAFNLEYNRMLELLHMVTSNWWTMGPWSSELLHVFQVHIEHLRQSNVVCVCMCVCMQYYFTVVINKI